MFELAALTAADAGEDEADRAELELEDATVYRGSSKDPQLFDILDVFELGPFRLRGRLKKVPPQHKALLRTPKAYTNVLTIPTLHTYSLEVVPGKGITIWALGAAAWYALKPSDEYRPIFGQILEKAALWLFFEDKYSTYSGKGKKIPGSVEELCNELSEHEMVTNFKSKPVSEMIDTHHRFLIRKMFEFRSDTEMWLRTPLFRHFLKNYPGEVGEARKLQDLSTAPVDSIPTQTPITPQGSIKLSRNDASPKDRVISVHSRSRTRIIFSFLENYICSRNIKASEVTMDHLVDIFFENFYFYDQDKARRVMTARAKELVCLMANSTRYPWTKRPVYKELSKLEVPDDFKALWAERFAQRRDVDLGALLSLPEDSDKEEAPVIEPKTPIVHTLSEESEDDEDVEDVEHSESDQGQKRPPRSSKGKSVLRPARPEIPVEPASPLDGHNDTSPVPLSKDSTFLQLKRKLDQRSFASDNDPKRSRTIASRSTSSNSNNTSAWPELRAGRGKPPIKVVRLPDTFSNQPGGKWMCSVDGCRHEISDAETSVGRKKIEGHYEFHGKQMKEAMEIIGLESHSNRGGGHHVENLLAKIEEMAQKWADSRPPPLKGLGD